LTHLSLRPSRSNCTLELWDICELWDDSLEVISASHIDIGSIASQRDSSKFNSRCSAIRLLQKSTFRPVGLRLTRALHRTADAACELLYYPVGRQLDDLIETFRAQSRSRQVRGDNIN